MDATIFKKAPHNPPHLFLPNTLYMLTASTFQREPVMEKPERKLEWIQSFLLAAQKYAWSIFAWVVLDDHYHALVQSPDNPHSLPKFVGSYHKFLARKWNEEDFSEGRKVWWNYWDTCVRSEMDFYNRLRYIFWNPVKHGLVQVAEEYKFSNYQEFIMKWQFEFDFTDRIEVGDVPEF